MMILGRVLPNNATLKGIKPAASGVIVLGNTNMECRRASDGTAHTVFFMD